MNTSMTCLCGTTHTFAANEFLAQCTGCSLLLWRTEEPGDAPAAAVDALYGAEAPALSDVAAVEHHAARVAAARAEDDHEAADSRERRLFAAVLRAVAAGAPNAAELARAALGE